jgi:hypothetical protein
MTTKTNRFSFPIKKPIVCKTDGKGLWSEAARTITIRRIELDYISPNFDFADTTDSDGLYIVTDSDMYVTFRVYFTKKDWNIHKHGFIYTDNSFIRDLRKQMNDLPMFRGIFTTRGDAAVDYTEQGMQGENYVSVAVLLKDKRMDEFLKRLGKQTRGALSGF